MENNTLTDRELWAEYWKNYKFKPIPEKIFYDSYIPKISSEARFIEIGGFPGENGVYFYKHYCHDITLLDFYVDTQIIHRIEQENNIPLNTVKSIEHDFFTYLSPSKYDLVFSLGFIEHFKDTADVIRRHTDLMDNDGKLLILLPNLRGINGAVQWLFDRKNLHIHNLNSMRTKYLRSILKQLNLHNICIQYTRKPMVWLEPKTGFSNKCGRILVKGLSCLIKLFPIRCRLLSPYIVISASK